MFSQTQANAAAAAKLSLRVGKARLIKQHHGTQPFFCVVVALFVNKAGPVLFCPRRRGRKADLLSRADSTKNGSWAN